MSFVGKLDEFRLSDLLQIIAVNRKSGKLKLTRRDREGLVVFRAGKIIYTASSLARETLGHALVTRGLIGAQDLAAALEEQHTTDEEKRLGTILVEKGQLEPQALESVLRQQIAKTLSELEDWGNGYFKFEHLELPDKGEIGVEASEFVHHEGLAPDEVLDQLAQHLDDAPAAPAAGAVADEPGSGGTYDTGLASLKTIIAEIRSPEFTGELSTKILEFGQSLFERGILFSVLQGNFSGMSQFGLDLGPPESSRERVRRIKIPLDQDSILAQAADRQAAFRGPLAPHEWNLYLISQLGGAAPREAAAVPMVVGGDVLLVLYGDNGKSGKPLSSIDGLEVVMSQAGLAMERNLLEKRVEQFRLRTTGKERG